MTLTEGERRAVVTALTWLRLEVSFDYALAGETATERAALTRAIKKLGGDPHPRSQRVLTAAAIAGARDGRRALLERRERPPRRAVGFKP